MTNAFEQFLDPPSGGPHTRRTLLMVATKALEGAGIEEARRNIEWMLSDLLKTSRAMLYAYPERVVPEEVVRALSRQVARRTTGEPLQYIVGYTEFFGLRIEVSPDVLIPRPETEQVVEEALQLIRGCDAPRVLDAGTGSGCIALALAQERPDAIVAACDLDAAALDVARANAAAHRFDVEFLAADLLAEDFVNRVPGDLDLFISNPPYVSPAERRGLPEEVRDHEPESALFAADDALLFYRALAAHAMVLMRPGGFVVVEIHAERGSAVEALFVEAGLHDVHLKDDLSGRPRIVTATIAPN